MNSIKLFAIESIAWDTTPTYLSPPVLLDPSFRFLLYRRCLSWDGLLLLRRRREADVVWAEERTTAITVLDIHLGKNSCSVAGFDETGRVVLRRRLTRDGVVRLGAKLPPCTMAMEASCGAHHLGHVLREQGHEVRLMSPEYAQPYVKAQKNDERDAEAIAEAATRPTMRLVELKSEAQLDALIPRRARTRLVGPRTALINQLCALFLERGIVVAKGRQQLQRFLLEMLDPAIEPPSTLSPRTRLLIEDMRLEWGELDQRIAALTTEFVARAREDHAARRLVSIPGFGELNATALVAAIGTGETFRSGRDLAAWLGLVPRQATTGGKPRLHGITKRGNTYLRTLLIHGARAALPSLSADQTLIGGWLRGLVGRAHKNKIVVALAGKLARIAWAVLRSGERYAARVRQPVAA